FHGEGNRGIARCADARLLRVPCVVGGCAHTGVYRNDVVVFLKRLAAAMSGSGAARYSENAEMTKQKILVARPIFPDVIDRLKQHFDVDWNNGDVLGNDELLKRLADKDGALTAGEPIGAATFAAAPRLRVVSNMAVGFNNFDMAAFNAAN